MPSAKPSQDLLPKFVIPGENINVSYDWVDVADGTGVVELYCHTAGESGLFTYGMNRTALEPGSQENTYLGSHPRRYLFQSGTVTFALSPFNTPRTVKGTAYLNFTLATLGNFGAGTNIFTGSVLKNSTTLGTASGSINVAGNIKTYNLAVTIPQTNFKIGDTLKVAITSSTSGTMTLEHDPQNRSVSSFLMGGNTHAAITASENPTKCMAYIPFKIDN